MNRSISTKRSRVRWYTGILTLAAFAVLGIATLVPIYPAPPGPTAGEDRAVPWLVELTPPPLGAKEDTADPFRRLEPRDLEQSREVLASRSWAVDTVAYSVVGEEVLARDLRRLSEAVSAEPGTSTLVRHRVAPRDFSEKGVSIQQLHKAAGEGTLFDMEGTEPTPVIYIPDPASIRQSAVDGIALSAPFMELRTLLWPPAVATIFSVPPLFFHLERLSPPQSGLENVRYITKKRRGLTFYEVDRFHFDHLYFQWRSAPENQEFFTRRINRLEQKLRPRTLWGGTIHARIKTLSINPRLTLVQIDLLDRTEVTEQFRYLALPLTDALPIQDWLDGNFAENTSERLDVNIPAIKRYVANVDLWRIPHRGWPHNIQTPAWETGLLDIPESTLVPIGGTGPPLRDQERFALPDFASLLDPPIVLIRWRDDARPGAERYVVEQWHPDAARDLNLRMVVIFANVTDEALASFVTWAHTPN